MVGHFAHVPDVRKIAVLRANALGDFVFAVPALWALRAAYPGAEIVYLGADWHAAYLHNRPSPVDRVVVVPPSRGVREVRGQVEDPQTLDAFFAAMHAEAFDVAIQMHGGGRYSNPFVQRLGARVSIGFKTPDAVPLDRWIPYIYFQREILRYLEVVSLIGAAAVDVEPRLPVLPHDVAESLRAVPHTTQPLVLLHPGAGDGRRRWPPTKFAQVGDALAAHGAHVLVNGIEDEEVLGRAVIAAMSRPASLFGGRPSLSCFTGLLSRCRLVVSNDSGPLHLAMALGTPTVGLYWCGNLINAGPMTFARHTPHLSWRLECPMCGTNCITGRCDHTDSMVAEISAEAVIDSAIELYERVARQAA